MLARLEELEGVTRAETNFSGDLLRLSVVDDAVLDSATALLASLGYGVEAVRKPLSVPAWYDARSVGQLSLIEAGVIADRVLAQLTQAKGTDVAALRTAVVSALHACFVTHAPGPGASTGTFRDECVRVAVAAAAPIIGPVQADILGRLLEEDMGQAHRAERS